MLGMVEGRRARGRQRMKYRVRIREIIGCGRTEEVLRLRGRGLFGRETASSACGRKESERKTENEIYGWNQRTNWMW